MGISLGGLSSGIDWQSMLSQLRAVETQRISALTTKKSTYQSQESAWQSFGSKLSALQSAAYNLKTSSAFSLFSISTNSSSSTVKPESILSATASSSATKGSYEVVVTNRAQVEKLASKSFSSQDTALGLSGTMLLNGRAVNVSSTYTLKDIQSAINTANSGTNPSGVTASITQEGTSSYRLTLTNKNEGASGIGLLRGASGDTLLQSLGFNDTGTAIKNQIVNGAQSDRFLDSTAKPISSTSVANLLGISAWSGNVTINGQSVTLDLSKTLSEMETALDTAGLSAQLVKETEGGNTYYRLQVANMTGSTYTDNNNVLETLGFIKGTHSDVVGVTSGSANTTYDSTTQTQKAITGSTLVKDIYGYLSNDPANDTITISGKDHAGANVGPTDLAITGTTTVQDLLTQIQSAFGNVTASVNGEGKIEVVDNATGASQLEVSLAATLTDPNSTLSFGTFTAAGTIRKRQIQAGEDAAFTIDGTSMTSSSNTVTKAIPGVTLNLANEDPSTTVTLNVDRDDAGIESKVNSMVTAYNDVISFVNSQMSYNADTQKTGGPLFGDNTLKSIKQNLQSMVLSPVGSSDIKYLSDIGIKVGSDNKLSIDSTKFQEKLESNFDDVVRLFSDSISSADAGISYLYSNRDTKSGTYSYSITQAGGDGVDMVGTIGGIAGVGSEDTLEMQDSSSEAYGLKIRYTGTSVPVSGTFTFSRGLASLLEGELYNLTDSIDGTTTLRQNSIQDNIKDVDKKITKTNEQIDRKMAMTAARFEAMESAMSKLQSMQSYLSSQLASLN